MLSGSVKYALSSLRKMASRSMIGILLRHFWHTYFGELDFTYIFWPQEQKERPAKTCIGFLPGLLSFFSCSSRIWLHWLQSVSDTIGSTGMVPHSLCGFSSHAQMPVRRVRLR